MESLFIAIFPIVFLFVGLALISGRSLSPGTVVGAVTRVTSQTLRWLWRDRPQRGGAGRQKPPQYRYRNRR